MSTIIRGSDNFDTNDVVTQTEYNSYDSGWLYPTFQNGWVDYDSTYGYTRYRKINNVVYIEGLIKNGTISTSLPCFTLPVGYRPAHRLLTSTFSNNAIGRLDVDTNGYVIPYSGSNAWYSVWCSFVAES